MDDLTGTTQLIPLPGFPPRVGGDISTAGAGLRRFGILDCDLSVNFASTDRAALVTSLLESCVVDPGGALPAGLFRELSIGKRTECLLVLAAGGPHAVLGFPFHCIGCGVEIELELTLREISTLQNEADLKETVGVVIGDKHVEFRKPTGRDQEAWSKMVFVDEREAAIGIIGALTDVPFKLKNAEPTELIKVEDALDEADPLVNFNCGVMCGECDYANEHEIDLVETALSMLYRAQQQLIVTVHRLASHYHWTEQEIFDVPEWRRRLYLDLIGAAKK